MTMRLREAKLNLDSFLKYNQPMSRDLNRLDNEITLMVHQEVLVLHCKIIC